MSDVFGRKGDNGDKDSGCDLDGAKRLKGVCCPDSKAVPKRSDSDVTYFVEEEAEAAAIQEVYGLTVDRLKGIIKVRENDNTILYTQKK